MGVTDILEYRCDRCDKALKAKKGYGEDTYKGEPGHTIKGWYQAQPLDDASKECLLFCSWSCAEAYAASHGWKEVTP